MPDLEHSYLALEPIADFRNLLIRETDAAKKKVWFSNPISFGTAGLRGLMQPGISGINGYTIAKAAAGLALFLQKQQPSRPLVVCISYDNRYFSKAFAQVAARVLAHYKITVKIASHLRPTPWLSFAVRTLKADAGIMITASHNPKEYNGFKVYLSDGAQVTSPFDKQLMESIHSVAHFELAGENDSHIHSMEQVIDEAYLEFITHYFPKEARSHLSLCYSPLCGTGAALVPKALQAIGFHNLHLVSEEMDPDPNFAGIATPNPETAIAMHRAVELMKQTKADIVLVTDPDADRIGCAVLDRSQAICFNGHEIALIILDYLIQQRAPVKGKLVVSSFVTTHLIKKICLENGLIHKEVLTGFKYIGQQIDELEKQGHPENFLLGAEESYGYLIGTHVRDKDACVISCLLAKAAETAKKEGKTLQDRLLEIYRKYGLSVEASYTLEFPAGTLSSELSQKLEPIFKNYPLSVLGKPVEKILDYKKQTQIDLSSKAESPIPLPKTDSLGLFTKNLWVIIRPSGTEPKIRFYAGLYEDPKTDIASQKTQAHTTLESSLKKWAQHLLQ